jgi:Ca-activated chloride channel family protein
MIAANHYAILDVSFDATAEEIRTAYHLSARRYHPDSSQTSGTSELFFKSQQAYDILSIPEKRASYDETLPKEEISTPGFAFKSLFSRTKIAPGDEKQLVYVLLDINAKVTPGKKAQRPVNLTLVLDRSTSMQGERMDMVKDNAIPLLRQSSQEDIVSIVTFSDRAEVLIPPTRLTDLPVIESKISRITP